MKKTYLIGILGVVAILVFINFLPTDENSNTTPKENIARTTQTQLSPQTNDEGSIVVSVIPKDQSNWSFEVTLDTHSGDLGEDLAEVSILLDENGNEYKPISWERDPLGGHHRSGVLRFGNLTPAPQSVTLIIRQVGGIAERKFEWTLLGN